MSHNCMITAAWFMTHSCKTIRVCGMWYVVCGILQYHPSHSCLQWACQHDCLSSCDLLPDLTTHQVLLVNLPLVLLERLVQPGKGTCHCAHIQPAAQQLDLTICKWATRSIEQSLHASSCPLTFPPLLLHASCLRSFALTWKGWSRGRCRQSILKFCMHMPGRRKPECPHLTPPGVQCHVSMCRHTVCTCMVVKEQFLTICYRGKIPAVR